MRTLIIILIFLRLGFCAVAAESSKPLLSFSLAATNGCFTQSVGQGLTMRVERCELGWEVGVFRQHGTDNLLYPEGNWHGAQMWQLSAWMHRTKTFPDERVISVLGTHRAVRIRLVGATVTGKAGDEKFTGGRAEIYFGPP